MKKWEDIIKKKMEEPGGVLPESVFDEFHARLDARSVMADHSVMAGKNVMANNTVMAGLTGHPSAKLRPLLWALAPAAAAGLAAILLLHEPSVTKDGIQVIQQQPTPVTSVTNMAEAAEPIEPQISVTQAVTPKEVHHAVPPQKPVTTDNPEPAEEIVSASRDNETVSPEAVVPGTPEPIKETVSDKSPVTLSSPFIPRENVAKPVGLQVAPAAGAVAGGGLLAAALTHFIGSGTPLGTNLAGMVNDLTNSYSYSGSLAYFTDEDAHHFPLFKEGLSVGIPVAPRLKITTGLEYSRYISTSSHLMDSFGVQGFQVERKQLAQYLGIPVRLDWSLAKNRLLDVYVGGGAAADYCIGARMIIKYTDPALKDNTQELRRDGFVFSLIGAGGIQFNATKRIGIYLEPELTWSKPPKKAHLDYYGDVVIMEEGDYRLETYRTEHPFMFTIATGLRVNLGK
ncbi:MAG: hypothetical protein IKR72_05955 [Bacteroidales bacterium]|nr:hypothetical protein [Bacteroidales bacterium]